MSATWYYKTSEGEEGPFTKDELRDLMHDGILSSSDRVRSEGSDLWVSIKRVSGVVAKEKPSVTRGVSYEDAFAEPTSGKRSFVLKNYVIILPIALLLLAIGGVATWWSNRAPIFPEPISDEVLAVSEERKELRRRMLRAPRPKTPSVSGLKLLEPKLVPGIEEMNAPYSVSLTPDLKTIVFASPVEGRKLDLFIASRSRASERFGIPQIIESCMSPEFDVFPTLSPDGLELIFVREGQASLLMYCSRNSRSEDFSEPVLWSTEQINPDDQNLHYPQFLNKDRVYFRSATTDLTACSVKYTVRMDGGIGFASPNEVSFQGAFPPYFISQGGVRAYFPWEEGINFALGSDDGLQFTHSVPVVNSEITGLIEGTIWVTPKEDVVFYCSTGPDQETTARRLWMLKF